MNSVDKKYLPVFCLLTIIFITSFAFADGVDDLLILKISAQDERAVIKTPDGQMVIIKPGDTLGASGIVIEIAVDRVVIEEKKGSDTEKVIIRLIDGKQKVERFKKTAEQSPAMFAPAAKDVNTRNQGSSFR